MNKQISPREKIKALADQHPQSPWLKKAKHRIRWRWFYDIIFYIKLKRIKWKNSSPIKDVAVTPAEED